MRQHLAHGASQLKRVAGLVEQLNPKRPWRIEITQLQPKRTASQNKLYWCVLTEIANETGHTKDEIHDAMKVKFLNQQVVKLADEELYIPASSAACDTQEFKDYLDKVIAFASTELGIMV